MKRPINERHWPKALREALGSRGFSLKCSVGDDHHYTRLCRKGGHRRISVVAEEDCGSVRWVVRDDAAPFIAVYREQCLKALIRWLTATPSLPEPHQSMPTRLPTPWERRLARGYKRPVKQTQTVGATTASEQPGPC